jgi:hypothetical protein
MDRLVVEGGLRLCFSFPEQCYATTFTFYCRVGYEPFWESRELAFVRQH